MSSSAARDALAFQQGRVLSLLFITGVALGAILRGYLPAVQIVFMAGYPKIAPYDDKTLGHPLLRKPFNMQELPAHVEG